MKRTVMLFCLVFLTALMLSTTLVSADVNGDDWPPRPPTPTPQAPETISGGFIELHVSPPETNIWTTIQWQDALGEWHDVDGWRGSLTDGRVRWFVGSDNLGKGPFRWLVFAEEDGPLLTTSESFYQPESANQTVLVTVILAD